MERMKFVPCAYQHCGAEGPVDGDWWAVATMGDGRVLHFHSSECMSEFALGKDAA